MIADIYRGLRPQGCLLLVEKVLGEESHFNRLFIKYYYDMKRRNGYSDTEIAQKREALEKLATIDPRKHRVVELRFFAGLTVPEVAEVMELSVTSIESEWRAARAWLSVELSR